MQRRLAAGREVLVAEVEAQHQRAQQHGDRSVCGVTRAGGGCRGSGAASLPPRAQEFAAEPDQHERRDQPDDVPAEQDRDGGLGEQLAEAPLLREDRHAVEGQHHPEEVGARFGGDHVVVVEEVVRGEREQRRGQRDPAVAEQPDEREPGEHGGGGEEREHEQPRGADRPREVVAEGQGRELDEGVGADREAGVGDVLRFAVRAQLLLLEQQEAVLRGQVRGQRQGRKRGPVRVRPVGLRAVAAEDEDRGQREQQQRRRQRRAAGQGRPPAARPPRAAPRGRRARTGPLRGRSRPAFRAHGASIGAARAATPRRTARTRPPRHRRPK